MVTQEVSVSRIMLTQSHTNPNTLIQCGPYGDIELDQQ